MTEESITVESCLAELREMDTRAYWRIVVTGYATPGGGIKQDVDIVHTALITFEQRIIRAPTLSEAMVQVRAWRRNND